MLQQLGAALVKLHEHAGLKLRGDDDRTIVLVETAELHSLNAEGLLSPDGIIYLHPETSDWVVVHEAAHYWANHQSFADLWLIEGYAEYLTSLAMQDLGSSDVPDPPQPICDQVPLMEWNYEPRATSRCGYDLGAAIFQAVEAEIGREQLQTAMRNLDQQSTPATSLDLLLALERTSGHDLTDLLKQSVFSPTKHAELEQRQQAWQKLRSAHQLADPLGVRLPPYLGDQIDALD
ncbi:MAG: hypothetical protein JOZ51_13120, partial [Chloroflexi bacterium]|nr:hypothetical protein [Chloroflexota bacterium]